MTAALRAFWHPVATADKVTDRPYAVELLGERVVLYRAGGDVVAFRDLCIHRGVRLSIGSVEGENLVCAYHGWTYGPSGACVRIPSQPADAAIPRKARTIRYHAAERHGLIWVCLADEPAAPLPEFPQPGFPRMGEPGTDWFLVEFEWDVNPARMTENSMDHTHFPFIHPGVLGDPERPIYPDVQVELLDDGMRYVIPNHGNNSTRHYRLTLPFTLEISVVDGADPDKRASMLFPSCPIASRRTRHWFISVRNYDLAVPNEQLIERDVGVVLQDRVIVENQFPEELPIDIREELHLKRADLPALEYRRLLHKIGVEW
jgi:phenylpropionate dioxygenase-like ring-hydroxylating dioxygenase large terminal subunit